MDNDNNTQRFCDKLTTDKNNLHNFAKSLCGFHFPAIFILIYLMVISVQMRRRNNNDSWILVFCRSGADALICISTVIQHQLYCFREQKFASNFVTWFGYAASSCFTVMLILEKFVLFKYPLHYPIIVTEKRLIKSSVCCILLVLACSIFMNCEMTFGARCKNRVAPPSEAVFAYGTVFFGIPLIISYVINIMLWRTIYRIGDEGGFGSQTFVLPKQNKINKSLGQYLKTVGFVFGATIWTTITIVPFSIAFSLREDVEDFGEFENAVWATFLLCSLYPVLNPIILLAVYPIYGKMLKKHARKLRDYFMRMAMRNYRRISISTVDSTDMGNYSRKISTFSNGPIMISAPRKMSVGSVIDNF